jgi:hypothetical protein
MAQNSRLFRWTLATLLMGLTAWVWWTLPAGAEWPNDAFSCRALRQDLYWHNWARRHCRGYNWRKYHARHHRYVAPSDPTCHRLISATGGAAQSDESAKSRALLAWQAEVAFHFGDRYLNISEAKDATIACAQAGVPDTVGSKIQDFIGVGHVRCHITARPCRVEARPLNKDDD